MIRAGLVSVAALAACAVYEDHVRIQAITPAESESLDCEKVCADPEIDSVNFCTVATRASRPHLVCELQVQLGSGPDRWEVGIEPPSGLDVTRQGPVALENCPLGACSPPVRNRMGDSIKDIRVTGCRVAQRAPVLAASKFLVCSVRTKTKFSVQ